MASAARIPHGSRVLLAGVLLCRCPGKTARAQAGAPGAPAALEAEALRLWSGRGAVSLLDSDPEAGALLLERVVPGTPLPPGREDASVQVAAEILSSLHAVS